MKKTALLSAVFLLVSTAHPAQISAVPGPDDQGGMIMPMVTITATSGPNTNPTAGIINIGFNPSSVPVLRPLTEWNPGDWFADTAAWGPDLSPVDGSVPGMPSATAGSGALFNNQYGFMFMAMPMMGTANIPAGKSLAIRLNSVSSPDLNSFNYGNADNRWDSVLSTPGDQVLWNGTMWHNYFTMPAGTAPGTYTAEFEIFIADTPFTGTTGFAQYDAAALSAIADPNFTSATVNYEFQVIPEPGTVGLLLLGIGFLAALRSRLRA